MPSISSKTIDALRGPVLSILRKSDLSSISAKKVRIALANTPADAMQGDVGSDVAGPRLLPRLGVDINDKTHKKAIDELIKECFDKISEEVQAKSVSQNNGTAGTPKLALPGLGGIPGSHSDAWPTSSATSNTKPSSSAASSSATVKKRSRAEDDEVISDEEDADPDTISKLAKKSQAKAKAPAKKKKAKAADSGDKEKKPPNPNNPFNKPVILSDEMSRICGGKEMPRYMITKQLWAYIKSNDLQNPSNKRKILCDPTLQSLFGKSEVDSFEMAKLISPHVTKKVDP